MTVDVDSVKVVTDGNNQLRVRTDSDETVNFGNGWGLTGSQTLEGVFYRNLEQAGATLRLNGPSNWQNPVNPNDVNNAAGVTPVSDVLPLINELNQPTIIDSEGRLPAQPASPIRFYYDVNGDGLLTPVADVLRQINLLNSAVPEGEASIVFLPDEPWPSSESPSLRERTERTPLPFHDLDAWRLLPAASKDGESYQSGLETLAKQWGEENELPFWDLLELDT